MSESNMNKNFEFLYTVKDYPIFTAMNLKSGCTFLKTLLYFIDHGNIVDDIDANEELILRGTIDRNPDHYSDPFVFFTIRKPIDRFMSLYAEKIYGDSPTRMMWFQKEVAPSIGISLERNLNPEAHHENAMRLIQWISQNIKGETNFEIDYHWRPQKWRYRQIEGYDPVLIPLEKLDQSLTNALIKDIPDIKNKIEMVKARNQSQASVFAKRIMSDELRKEINRVYKNDLKLYRTACTSNR